MKRWVIDLLFLLAILLSLLSLQMEKASRELSKEGDAMVAQGTEIFQSVGGR